VDPDGSAMTGTGPVITKQVNKAKIIIVSIVVFMKALLLLVGILRSTKSLAIWLRHSLNDGSKPAWPRSAAGPPSAGVSNVFFSALAARWCIHHLSSSLCVLNADETCTCGFRMLYCSVNMPLATGHCHTVRMIRIGLLWDPAPDTTVTGKVRMTVSPNTTAI